MSPDSTTPHPPPHLTTVPSSPPSTPPYQSPSSSFKSGNQCPPQKSPTLMAGSPVLSLSTQPSAPGPHTEHSPSDIQGARAPKPSLICTPPASTLTVGHGPLSRRGHCLLWGEAGLRGGGHLCSCRGRSRWQHPQLFSFLCFAIATSCFLLHPQFPSPSAITSTAHKRAVISLLF